LNAIDDLAIKQGVYQHKILSTMTAVAWILTLLPCKAPVICTVLSVFSIIGAYVAAPLMTGFQMEALIIGGFFTVFIFNSILGWGVRACKWIPALFAFYGWWLLMWAFLFKYQVGAWS